MPASAYLRVHLTHAESQTQWEKYAVCVRQTSPLKEPGGVNVFVRETERRGPDNSPGGAPPSACKQDGDSSTCPENKHKYLFLLEPAQRLSQPNAELILIPSCRPVG